MKAGGVKAQSSVAGMAACTSGRLGCTSRRVVVLRGRQRGQRGWNGTGGEQLRRRSLLTCGWTGRDSGDGEVRG